MVEVMVTPVACKVVEGGVVSEDRFVLSVATSDDGGCLVLEPFAPGIGDEVKPFDVVLSPGQVEATDVL